MVNRTWLSALVATTAMLTGQAAGKLKPRMQNGDSYWGTLDAPTLPRFREDNPLPEGNPWGVRNPSPSSFEDVPSTGVVREVEFTVTRAVIAPDGIEHEALLVNNQFPGPLIEANWGDEIHITVHNNIQGPEEGFTLHTHGLLHRFHPWEDGVPSISQCPIAPGGSYTYKVVADQYGTSWWHSHYSSQYVGGVFGPLVIHGPSEAEYDIDVGPVMLHDYYHAGYHDIIAQLMAPNLTAGVPYSTNNMINGKMFATCANTTLPCTPNAPISQFQFQKGKKHLLRLINAGSEGQQIFSIDEHEMTVVSADYVPIQPYTTKSIILAVGQRADVVVEANGDREAYFMRSNISHCNAALQPHAVAAIYYDDADDNQNPYSDAWDLPENPLCMEAPLEQTVPVKEVALPEPDLTIQIIYSMFLNSSAVISFTANNVTFRGDSNRPTLLQANEGNTTFAAARNVQNVGDAKSVRVVAYNNVAEPHPMHLHGFNMYIVAQGGPGEAYNGTVVRSNNPMRRDTFTTAAYGYTVFQFDAADNPGMWPFHCHMAVHSATGMVMQFLTSPDKVAEYEIPSKLDDACAAWIAADLPGGIDSGA